MKKTILFTLVSICFSVNAFATCEAEAIRIVAAMTKTSKKNLSAAELSSGSLSVSGQSKTGADIMYLVLTDDKCIAYQACEAESEGECKK